MAKLKDNVISLEDYLYSWESVFRIDDPVNGSTLSIYVNTSSRQFDVVQTNDEGESITTHLTADTGKAFLAAINRLNGLTHGRPERRP